MSSPYVTKPDRVMGNEDELFCEFKAKCDYWGDVITCLTCKNCKVKEMKKDGSGV